MREGEKGESPKGKREEEEEEEEQREGEREGVREQEGGKKGRLKKGRERESGVKEQTLHVAVEGVIRLWRGTNSQVSPNSRGT